MVFRSVVALLAAAVALGPSTGAVAAPLVETPSLEAQVKAGKLPAIDKRVPEEPWVDALDKPWLKLGQPGGDLRVLMGRARDVRVMVIYGYARLVGYDNNYNLVPDIAKSFEVKDGRIFTFKLRKGHKWSDGSPFTSEDFRYFWQDVANNKELSPAGPPVELNVDGEWPKVETPDPFTVRYTWSKPNPFFLPALARADPLYIYRPSTYLKNFHKKFAKPDELEQKVKTSRRHSWAALHNREDAQYANDNPALPTLEPWVNTTAAPAERFVFERNPYFHRVDREGRQLPYIDRVLMDIADAKLIPAKTGAGESDLQERNLDFADYTFLRESEKRANYEVRLWQTALGSQMAIFPNLNANDPVWRKLLRDVRFRRALSLGVDRSEINQAIFNGLGMESANTVQPASPVFLQEFQTRWATYDPKGAAKLLDEIGLAKRDAAGIRLLPDGRPLEIVVETAGERQIEVDILELVRGSWQKLGIKLFIKPSQREVLRNRIYAGDTIMSVWTGVENGIALPSMSPHEFVPIDQVHFQWPKWGQHHQTGGRSGEAPDTPEGNRLLALYKEWRNAKTDDARAKIWREILAIHADNVFSIGTVTGVKQPIVVNRKLQNLPAEGMFAWEPGARFGVYHLDRVFWAK